MRSETMGPGSFWIVQEANELLRECDWSPSRQAEELAAKADVYEDGIEVARALHDEMRRRARAGVRFWPTLEDACESAIEHIESELAAGRAPVAKATNKAKPAKVTLPGVKAVPTSAPDLFNGVDAPPPRPA